jgi:hypothetical protein
MAGYEREEWLDAKAAQWSWAHPATCGCRECWYEAETDDSDGGNPE